MKRLSAGDTSAALNKLFRFAGQYHSSTSDRRPYGKLEGIRFRMGGSAKGKASLAGDTARKQRLIANRVKELIQ